ncbi:ABC transporter substrate-binding protein [Occultella gossypii]|uniref:Sugar ABC transporter substrate-binding protein n=1 Tax=Occultella gossypii TaxID=2800820 RepID=A0ABS7S8W2_9MICO|nr:sugar ABC transporter substrate-binding protein [Occultella gossypii]MBZ2196787.1 sugar ABC transporter substrate-binding protein [Occultella gossypii]
MDIRRRRLLGAVGALGATALVLAACSPGSSDDSGDEGSGDGESTTVTFRLWDEAAATAYEESFAAFTEANPEITVDVEVVPWANYWERLPQDIGSGTMADIFWANTSNFALYADNGNLIDITEALGDEHDEWTQSIVDLYTRDGSLWGVPQLSDSIALFYNKDLVDAAGIDPTTLRWDPTGADDTFLPAAQQLTVDSAGVTAADPAFNPDDVAQFGFNAQNDLQAIYIDFLASNGGVFQDEDNQFAFNSPEGVAAFQYVVDLINTHHVSPSAADTSQNGDLARDLFVQGKMALFQSGQYSLPAMADAEFEWGLAPMVEGPEGRVGVVHGVAALGNAATENLEATTAVLAWLGSAEGQLPLGANGASFPAATDAQSSFTDYWTEQGVDTQVFLDAAQGDTTAAPIGPRVQAGMTAYGPYFEEMFAGRLDVPTALQQAQDAGNEAQAE